MAKNIGTPGPHGSTGKKRHRSKSRSSQKKQEMIILPAIKAATPDHDATPSHKNKKATKAATRSTAANKKHAQKKHTQKKHNGVETKTSFDPSPASPTRPVNNAPTVSQNDRQGGAADFLPEYRSQTNGLRELLSTIDPLDHAYTPHGTPFETYPTETAMHIPRSRPGIPVSPDLPIGPTRWGLYFSGAIGAVAMLFVSALAFSHFTSPTGIDWTKAQTKAGQTYSWMVASLSAKPASHYADTSDPLAGMVGLNETQVATASRISTTAASPQKGSLKAPTAKEIFMTPKELENQIMAFEKRTGRTNKRLSTPSKSPAVKAKAKPRVYEQLVVVPAANIDPDMESQIFKRASSYLKQRDISSARMILQYAATLGSGISAMALAETFDPNYLKGVNLHGVRGSRPDARKWYDMAARLGITEANARLTDLK